MTNEIINNHPLFQAQVELEEEMRSLGIDAFQKAVDKAVEKGSETRTQAVRRLMGHCYTQMLDALNAFIAEANTGKAGRKHSALAFVKLLDPHIVAHMTVRAVMDSISNRSKVAHVAIELAHMIEDEVHFRTFEEQKPAGFKAMQKNAKKSSNVRYRRNAMLVPARAMDVKLEEWTPRERLFTGTKLIELFIQATGLAKLTRTTEGSNANTPIYIEATEETKQWINDENSRLQSMMPVYMPTIIPPKPWTSPFSGGYWTNRVRRLTLVRTRNRRYLSELANIDMPIVYGGVNALQETAWSINPAVHDVMEKLWANASTRGYVLEDGSEDELFPSPNKLEAPDRPYWLTENMTKEDMTEEQRAEFRQWKADASAVADENVREVSARMTFLRMLGVARRFRDHEEFYFPHTLDWRGRAYPVPLYLQPQGSDAQRGLLQLAHCVPLTDEDGVLWLAVHGAGLWGVDKVSLEARREWVEQNEQAILASAEDPFENTFWQGADKPWQALAFCFDWAGWKREGYAFESYLPVQMDGTCNGLQNFSAILRDEIGGAAVNLVPADKPQDIYMRVCEVVMARVEADLFSEERMKTRKDGTEGTLIAEIARGWHGHLNRKVTKRPVMTLAYGARRFGFIQQVFEDTVEPWKKKNDGKFPFEGSGWEAASYMGQLIWESVGEVVVAACAAMDWLQEAARVVAKENLPVMWMTPSGLLVQQNYRVPNIKRYSTTFEDVVVRLSVQSEGDKIDSRKQAAGISPNWVHSLDASHMMRTIKRAHDEGIRSFCMIHDSYGTHAGNAAALANFLREEFVAMYSETDVLDDLRNNLQSQIFGEELPDLPAKGNLDLDQVLDSPFFFA